MLKVHQVLFIIRSSGLDVDGDELYYYQWKYSQNYPYSELIDVIF